MIARVVQNLLRKGNHMALQAEYEADNLCVLHISGVLNQAEFAATQKDLARKIDFGSKPRVLAIVQDFAGWEQGTDWNDLDFLVSHSGEIAKIAIVADPKWETQALAFAGAGVRKAPVRFFPSVETEQARRWIVE